MSLLRERAVPPGAAESEAAWIHRGLTSQDVLDTALVLAARDVLDAVGAEVRRQVRAMGVLADAHRSTVAVGRTLSQHAVPITFATVAAGWLEAVLDAGEEVDRVRSALPAQIGGAAGTLAASTELARLRGAADPAAVSIGLAEATAAALDLAWSPPWHTRRTPFTRIGDALVTACDAWGRIAADVVTGSRPEIGELAEPAADGRGGSSTMPQKQNPVLAVLLRRTAIAAPPLAATLHTASALAVDQRPDGAWHAEWDTVRTLARRTAVAARQATELVSGLRVDAARMRAHLDAAGAAVTAERETVRRLVGATSAEADDHRGYVGAADLLVDATLARARTFLEAER